MLDQHIFPTSPRLFRLQDRVKIGHMRTWWSGTVKEFRPRRRSGIRTQFDLLYSDPKKIKIIEHLGNGIVTIDDYSDITMFIQTDKVIGPLNGIYNGCGFQTNTGNDIIFAWESEYPLETKVVPMF